MRHRATTAPTASPRRRPPRGQSRKAPSTAEAARELKAESSPEWGDTESQAAELEALLDVEYSSDWWKDAEGAPLADLLQQLVGCVDGGVGGGNPQAQAYYDSPATDSDASTSKMAPPVDQRHKGAGGRRRRCFQGNKNALAARLNRLRKKEYVSGLERSVARLHGENQRLQTERRALGGRVRELETEARYLRAVLANDSALSQLLGRLTGLGGARLSTSLFLDLPAGSDHDYALPGFRQNLREEDEMGGGEPPSPGGVCLHVDKEKVSVEFCASCARNAASAAKIGLSCVGAEDSGPAADHMSCFVLKGAGNNG
uniref:CREB/ATF bZIP transcription factor n=1 Tax=Leptobrachium leishanense TaxID=445787 RepID=A0A8C5M617_9ANUR